MVLRATGQPRDLPTADAETVAMKSRYSHKLPRIFICSIVFLFVCLQMYYRLVAPTVSGDTDARTPSIIEEQLRNMTKERDNLREEKTALVAKLNATQNQISTMKEQTWIAFHEVTEKLLKVTSERDECHGGNKNTANITLENTVRPIQQTSGEAAYQYDNWTHYCEHDQTNNGTCYKMLAPHVKSKPAWFFLGDSQMLGLAGIGINYPYNITSKRSPKDTWCGAIEYYNLTKASEWKMPSRGHQGPTSIGLKKHFCSDVGGRPGSEGTRRFGTDRANFMEVLVVDFASDVEQQSLNTSTSQETVTLYISRQLEMLNLTKIDSVCVANAGLHDQKLCSLGKESFCREAYIANVQSYLKLLETICGSIIWISISSVRGDESKPQRNDRSIEWNVMVKANLAGSYANNTFFFLDVWNVSSHNAVHNDNIHFTNEYYQRLGSLFSRLM